MPTGTFNDFPIPFTTTEDPTAKADKSTTINGLSLAQNRVLKSGQFSEAMTGEKMLANLTYRTVNTFSGSQSIDLGGTFYIDASGVVGIRGSLGSTDDVNDFRMLQHAGTWYCSSAQNAPTTYGMLTVASGGSGGLCYQTFASSSQIIYTRIYTNGAWGSWYKNLSTPDSWGISVGRTNVWTDGQSVTLGSGNYIDADGIEIRASSPANRKTLSDWAAGINKTTNHTIPGNDSILLRLASGTSGFALLNSPSSAASGLYGIGCSSGGVAYYQELVPGTDITMTRNSANIRFANGNTNEVDMLVILTKGSYTV